MGNARVISDSASDGKLTMLSRTLAFRPKLNYRLDTGYIGHRIRMPEQVRIGKERKGMAELVTLTTIL